MNKSPEVERFYTTTFWRNRRKAFLEDHNYLCQVCLSKGLIEAATEVHHIIPLTAENINDPRITVDETNLMALCDSCHDEQHRKKRWRCDSMGRIAL